MSSHMSPILQDVYLIMPPNIRFLLWHQQSFVDPFFAFNPLKPRNPFMSDCSSQWLFLNNLIGMHPVFYRMFQLSTIFWIPILSFKIFETPSSLMLLTNLICTLSHCPPHYWKYWRQNKSLQNSLHPPIKNRNHLGLFSGSSFQTILHQPFRNSFWKPIKNQDFFISTAFSHPKGLLHWHEGELLRLSSIYSWEICISVYSWPCPFLFLSPCLSLVP